MVGVLCMSSTAYSLQNRSYLILYWISFQVELWLPWRLEPSPSMLGILPACYVCDICYICFNWIVVAYVVAIFCQSEICLLIFFNLVFSRLILLYFFFFDIFSLIECYKRRRSCISKCIISKYVL